MQPHRWEKLASTLTGNCIDMPHCLLPARCRKLVQLFHLPLWIKKPLAGNCWGQAHLPVLFLRGLSDTFQPDCLMSPMSTPGVRLGALGCRGDPGGHRRILQLLVRKNKTHTQVVSCLWSGWTHKTVWIHDRIWTTWNSLHQIIQRPVTEDTAANAFYVNFMGSYHKVVYPLPNPLCLWRKIEGMKGFS